eukprot:2094845-Rhodomonas_salina.3
MFGHETEALPDSTSSQRFTRSHQGTLDLIPPPTLINLISDSEPESRFGGPVRFRPRSVPVTRRAADRERGPTAATRS